MATIKSFSDLQQSKRLAEILPLESADMYWWSSGKRYYIEAIDDGDFNEKEGHIRAWSLASLLGVLPNGTDIVKDETDTENEKYMCTVGVKYDIISTFGNNPVDACVEMIERLNKLNLWNTIF